MKKTRIITLPLITQGDIQGYEVHALHRWMNRHGLAARWRTWFNGQTGAIVDGKYVVFKWDAEAFLEGLPNTD